MPHIQYFADRCDQSDLIKVVANSGAYIIPSEPEKGSSGYAGVYLQKFVYISFIDPKLLKYSENDLTKIATGSPIIEWSRSFVDEKRRVIVAGFFDWNNFDEVICRKFGIEHSEVVKIGSLYKKINRWIRDNWSNIDRDQFWFGKNAADLATNHGYPAVSNISDEVIASDFKNLQ